ARWRRRLPSATACGVGPPGGGARGGRGGWGPGSKGSPRNRGGGGGGKKKRLLWLGVGIAIGALVVRQVSRKVQSYAPANLVDSGRNSAAGIGEAVQDFVADAG